MLLWPFLSRLFVSLLKCGFWPCPLRKYFWTRRERANGHVLDLVLSWLSDSTNKVWLCFLWFHIIYIVFNYSEHILTAFIAIHMIHIVIVHSRRYQIPFRIFVLNPMSQIRAVETWFDEYKVGRKTSFLRPGVWPWTMGISPITEMNWSKMIER